jgi:hypothetical protein
MQPTAASLLAVRGKSASTGESGGAFVYTDAAAAAAAVAAGASPHDPVGKKVVQV